ncbi:MAG: ATP-binding cassette domain-containing protein [Pseudomonadota bacterium]
MYDKRPTLCEFTIRRDRSYSNNMTHVIHRCALSKDFQLPEMKLKPGTQVSVVGPSGSGKTDYCIQALGLKKNEQDNKGTLADKLDHVAFLPSQVSHLFSGIKATLLGEIQLSYQFKGAQVPENLENLVDADLKPLLSRDPFSFSGGETTKAGVTIAKSKRPNFWILDQTYEALFHEDRFKLRDFLLNELKSGASLLETHSASPPWIECADTCIFLEPGKPPIVGKYRDVAEQVQDASLLLPKTRISRRSKVTGTDNGKEAPIQQVKIFGGPTKKSFELKANSVQFSYSTGKFCAGPISLQVVSKECIGVIGPNGAGKTTLIKLISGLLSPNSGSVELCGENLSRTSSVADKMLYCFQNPDEQIYSATVEEELFSTSKILKKNIPNPKWIIQKLGLGDVLSEKPANLTLSQKKLLTFGSAILSNPMCITLDEPTAFLDPSQTRAMVEIIRRFHQEGGSTLIVSHDNEFLGEVATRLLWISDGKLKGDLSPIDWPGNSCPFALSQTRGTKKPTTSFEELLRRNIRNSEKFK